MLRPNTKSIKTAYIFNINSLVLIVKNVLTMLIMKAD